MGAGGVAVVRAAPVVQTIAPGAWAAGSGEPGKQVGDLSGYALEVLNGEVVAVPGVTIAVNDGSGVFVPGSYHVWVHNYGHQHFGFTNLAGSQGSVTLLGKTGSEGTFVVGTASGDPENDIWLVCTFDLDSDGNMSNLSQSGGYNQFVPGTEVSQF